MVELLHRSTHLCLDIAPGIATYTLKEERPRSSDKTSCERDPMETSQVAAPKMRVMTVYAALLYQRRVKFRCRVPSQHLRLPSNG